MQVINKSIQVEELLWDSTAFDNNYSDIMPLVESIRNHGIVNPHVTVTKLGDRFLIINGRNLARAAVMLGYKTLMCTVIPDIDAAAIFMMRIKETEWKPGYKEGRNYHAERTGY